MWISHKQARFLFFYFNHVWNIAWDILILKKQYVLFIWNSHLTGCLVFLFSKPYQNRNIRKQLSQAASTKEGKEHQLWRLGEISEVPDRSEGRARVSLGLSGKHRLCNLILYNFTGLMFVLWNLWLENLQITCCIHCVPEQYFSKSKQSVFISWS